MNRFRRTSLLMFPIVILLSIYFRVSNASAHQLTPVKSSPADGEILAEAPEEVRLTFTEEILEAGSGLQVFDAQGRQVDPGNGGVDLFDAQHAMLVAGLPVLQEGVYLVKWQVILLDGDVSTGQYYFGIGNVVLPKISPSTPAPTAVAKTKPPAILWVGVGALSLLLFILAVFFIRNVRS